MGSHRNQSGYLSPFPNRRRPDQEPWQGTRATAMLTRRSMLATTALGLLAGSAGTAAGITKGEFLYAVHISLAPTWFDPAETPGIVTPFMLLYAMHDGLVRPMPGNPTELCLAEAYTPSADGLSHEFRLREGTRFHNNESNVRGCEILLRAIPR
jgi:ABC-type transport system substrate-binding protein